MVYVKKLSKAAEAQMTPRQIDKFYHPEKYKYDNVAHYRNYYKCHRKKLIIYQEWYRTKDKHGVSWAEYWKRSWERDKE